jgi:SAM-dependent methyltransferase
MTEAESAAFYGDEYRLLYEGSAGPTPRNVAAQRARAEALGAFAQAHIRTVKRHLDIGCSMGILLQGFQGIYHCQSVGVEPGEVHRNDALKEGLTVYSTLDNLEKHEKNRFDLLSMAHVLEHLPDPVGYLLHLRDTLLDPAGWLLLEVPNLYAHDSFETAHLVSYGAHTLTQTLEKAGFDVVRLEKHGRPRSDLLPLYITLLARPVPETRRNLNLLPEKRVALKRRLGMLRRRVVEHLFPHQAWRF